MPQTPELQELALPSRSMCSELSVWVPHRGLLRAEYHPCHLAWPPSTQTREQVSSHVSKCSWPQAEALLFAEALMLAPHHCAGLRESSNLPTTQHSRYCEKEAHKQRQTQKIGLNIILIASHDLCVGFSQISVVVFVTGAGSHGLFLDQR